MLGTDQASYLAEKLGHFNQVPIVDLKLLLFVSAFSGNANIIQTKTQKSINSSQIIFSSYQGCCKKKQPKKNTQFFKKSPKNPPKNHSLLYL